CGNVVTKKPHFPCKEKCTPPPPEKCPPGTTGTPPDCLTPKKGNFHGGGVPKGAVTGKGGDPVEVETSRKGGGGVVDSPTKKPGSETGGKAGGGATKPDPTRTPNKPEGGSGDNNTNDGSAGGAP